MGCPAPKIVKNGEGSALMKEPLLVGRIVSAVSAACDDYGKPLTIKIRKGFTEAQANAVEIARIAQEPGASAVTVHGRTRDQFYSGNADWDAIRKVKEAISIPVIANGDVISADSAQAILNQTNCDGIMIARGALGNPWIFQLGADSDQTQLEWITRFEMSLRHCRMVIEHKGERLGILEMRKHLSWYIKGFPDATKLRLKINKTSSYKDIEALFGSL